MPHLSPGSAESSAGAASAKERHRALPAAIRKQEHSSLSQQQLMQRFSLFLSIICSAAGTQEHRFLFI